MDERSKPSSSLSVIALVVPAQAYEAPARCGRGTRSRGGLPDEGGVLCEVALRQDASVALYVGDDGAGDVAPVEGVRALAGDCLEHVSKVGLAEEGRAGQVAAGHLPVRHEYPSELAYLNSFPAISPFE